MKNKTGNGAPDWGAVHRVRVGNVRKLLLHRYGVELPDDDAGREDLRILLHVKANACRPENRVKALLNEIGLQAPWMPAEKARKIAEEIAAKPLKVTADWLGQALNVDIATREALAIWQIGAVGLDAAGRAARRREKDRERKRRQRARQPRGAWLEQHSLSRTKPWEALSVSRATYYRRLAKGGETGVSAPPVAVSARSAHCARSAGSPPGPAVEHGVRQVCPMDRKGTSRTHLSHVSPDRADIPVSLVEP